MTQNDAREVQIEAREVRNQVKSRNPINIRQNDDRDICSLKLRG